MLRLDRYGRNQQEDVAVGKHHAKSEQNPVNSTRGSHSWCPAAADPHVNESRPDTCKKIIGCKPFGSPVVLNTLTKYPDRKSTRLNSSHVAISYAVFCLKKKK